MSDRLLALAAAQDGVLSTADAESVDVDGDALVRLRRSGTLVRVRRGAYVLADRWTSARPEEQLALRTRAILRSRPGVATHQSALALHGLPLYGVPTDVVDLAGDVARVRRRSGLRIHAMSPEARVITVAGVPVVDVATALAQVLLRDGRTPGVTAADAAFRRGLIDRPALVARVSTLAQSPRAEARTLRWVDQVDARSESVGETRTRLLLRDLGHRVRPQVRISDPDGTVFARVDFLVEDRVVVEFDGLVKYEGAEGRAALVAEKRREDRLRARGYVVVRLTWSDLDRPERVAQLIRHALARVAA